MRWSTPTPSAATAWPSSSRPPTSYAPRSTRWSRRTEPTSPPQSRAARPNSSRAPTTPRQRPLLRRACYGRSTRTISRVGSENQIALIRELGASFEQSVYPGAARSARRLAQESGDDDTPPPKPNRPCPLRPSRSSASPASSSRKRTSIGTLPPSATRSSRP